MINNIYKSIISALAILQCAQMTAQSADTFREQTDIRPGVETWQMTRHGGLSPSLYTGVMQWSLPLYTYKDYDFTLPIALEYNYDGFRPGESTGGVGLGWALSAGGVITREVRGLRDECLKQQEDGRYVYGYYYAWKNRVAFSADGFELLRHDALYTETEDGGQTLLESLRDDLPNNVLVSRDPQYYACYDAEPDVFRFNFCGHRGEFRFNSEGRIDIFCQDEPSCDFEIEPGTMTGPDCSTFNFKITTADGYEYSFGTTANSWEYSTGLCYSTDDPKGMSRTGLLGEQSITAWRLTSVKSPSGITLEFVYDETPDIEVSVFDSYTPAVERLDVITDPQETVPSYRDKNLSICRTRLLKQIILKSSTFSQTLVEFNWTERTSEQDEICEVNYDAARTILYNIPRGHVNRVLSSIVVRNGSGTAVEDIRLGHGTIGSASGPRRLTLVSVETRSRGKWTFGYAPAPSGIGLPKADDKGEVDIYGYWGGSGMSDLRGRVNMNDGGLRYQGACENHSFEKASTGALISIGYPTGGSTRIQYENNHIKWLLERGWYDMPHLEAFDKDVCGVRVKSVTDWNAGVIAGRKDFEYEDGVLWYYPRLTAQCDYSQLVLDPASQTSFLVRLRSTFYTRTGFGIVGYSPRLGYGKVTQQHTDGSRTEHIFCGWQDYPDGYSEESITSVLSDTSPLNDTVKNRMLKMFLPASLDWSLFRGAPKSVSEYDADGLLRYGKSLSYEYDVPLNVIEGANLFSISGSINKFCFKPVLASVVESVNGLSIRKEWSRDGNGRISEECTTDLQSGYEKSVKYSYCAGLSSSNASVCPGAVSVLQTSVRESAGKPSLVTGRVEFSYNRDDKSALPSSMTIYRIDSPDTEKNLKQQFASLEQLSVTRDSHLRPTKISMPGGAYVEYAWDAYGRNILKRTVNGAEGVTSYTWKDMVGLASAVYPSGLSESYTYDAHNRLSKVKDSDGKLVSSISALLCSERDGKTSRIVTQRFLDSAARMSMEEMVYYDALGRESVTVTLSEEALYPSILQPVCYDLIGRADSAVFLPYAVLSFSDIALDSLNAYDWKTAQAKWYRENYADGECAFAERTYEPWQAGRVLRERKPGADYLSAGKAVQYQYDTNGGGDTVLRFAFTRTSLDSASVACTGVWESAKLAKSIRISEENDTTVTFSDALGRTLLSRCINNGVRHDTYYIRDLRDSLALVIQPEGSSRMKKDMVMPLDGEFVRDYCFAWLYDGMGRLTWSHVPGDGGSRMAYDRRGRIVYCDDACLRAAGKGRYFIYDDYDRLKEEGLCVPSADIKNIREALVYGISITQMVSSREPVREVSYRTASVPASGIPSDMTFEEVPEVVTTDDICSIRCMGAISYERLREMTETMDGYTRRAYWYDARGRVVQMLEKTSDGWSSRYSTGYDFIGNVIAFDEKHTDPSGVTHELKTKNTYDGWCRLVKSVRTLDGEGQTPVEYSYDALGRLSSKTREHTGTSYNIHETTVRDILGRVTGIEARQADGETLFEEQISYRLDALVSENTICNGFQQLLPVRNAYSYDHMGRLTGNSRYIYGAEIQNGTEKDIEYDLNGNLSFVRRNIDGKTDVVCCVYQGNKITVGYINPQEEFLEMWFEYDVNGNMTNNPFTGDNMSYNYLNLPTMIGGTTYTYLSDGTKVSVKLGDGSKKVTRGSFVYNVTASGSASLESVSVPEGRIYCSDTPDGEPWMCWNITDHLGNVRRVVFSRSGTPLEINDYLPYGTRMEEYSHFCENGRRWHYAGKELQDFGSYGNELIDFGARYYCPYTCSWTSPDPLADRYLSTSPYAYCNSNPVNFVDPNGEAVYYSYKGDFITSDNIDDGKIYLVEDKYVNINANSAVLVRNAFPEGFKEVGGLIIQYRFEEGSDYTVSTFETVGGDESVTGYILEPEGPDTTTPNMNKRIPEGVYEIDNYHSEKYNDNYILFNDLVPKSRKILYHKGRKREHTKGCQLVGDSYKENGTIINLNPGGKFNELKEFIEKVGAKNVRTIIKNK